MSEVIVELSDGSQSKFPVGTTLQDVLSSIDGINVDRAIAAKVDGELVDLTQKLERDCKLEIVTFDSDEGKETYWHSASHIMASAVQMLFPKAKFAIGPAINEGFYYDFDVDKPFTPDDLERIGEKMHKIIGMNLPFFRNEITNWKLFSCLQSLMKNINWKSWKI